MKIEQLIVQHLYNSKKVTLQDIGIFTLSADIAIPVETDKEFSMPEKAVTFEFDKKARQDDDLINFIVAHTRKIKPLASSDLESYTLLAKQFLNIGKPFPIEGLGVLQKTQSGEYEFAQGLFINAKLDAAPALLKEKTEDEISFSTTAKEPSGTKKWMLLVLLLAVIAVGALVYYFVKKGDKDNTVEKVVPNTTDTIAAKKDTVVKPIAATPDTTAVTLKPTATIDASSFKIVIREYTDRGTADRLLAKFTSFGHKLVVYSKDSSNYRIAMGFTRPLSDTSRTKDSLKILFGGKPYIEKN